MSGKKHATAMAVSNGVVLLCHLGILALLTRTIPLETVGAYGLLMALTQPAYMLLLLGLRGNLAADATRRIDFRDALALRGLMAGLFCIGGCGSVALWRPELLSVAAPLLLLKTVEMLGDLLFGAAQRAGDIPFVARGWALRGGVGLCGFGTGVAAFGSLDGALWVQVLCVSAAIALHDLPILQKLEVGLRPRWRKTAIHGLLAGSAPLGLSQCFIALQMALPRLIMGAVLGPVAVALYLPAAYLERAAVTGMNSFDQALGWRLARHWAAGERRAFSWLLARMFGFAAGVGAAGTLLIILGGGALVDAVFGKGYADTAALLLWIMPATALRLCANVLQSGIVAQRRFRMLGWLQGVLFTASLPAMWLGVTVGGLIGIAQAITLLALLRLAVLSGIFATAFAGQKGKVLPAKAVQSVG